MTERATVDRPRGSASIFSIAAITRGSVSEPGVTSRNLRLSATARHAGPATSPWCH
jgi:hypothetical protein